MKRFYLGVGVCHRRVGAKAQTQIEILATSAASEDEAHGWALRQMRTTWTEASGWGEPRVTMLPVARATLVRWLARCDA